MYVSPGLTFINCIFFPQSAFVFRVDFRTETNYFPIQH